MWFVLIVAFGAMLVANKGGKKRREAAGSAMREQMWRARTRLNLRDHPDFASYQARLQTLGDAARRGLSATVLLNYGVRAGQETGQSLPAKLTFITEYHPSNLRYDVAPPKLLLLQVGELEVVLTPGAVIFSPSALQPATVVLWDNISARYETVVIKMRPQAVPAGATVRGDSFQHERPDGSPDRRYSHNPRVYLVEYTDVILASVGSEVLRVRLLDRAAAELFATTFTGASRQQRQEERGPRQERYRQDEYRREDRAQQERERAPRQPRAETRQLSAYEVLGVAPGSDAATVRAAYIKLVKQYHPDKVAHLAPEFRTVAEERTKEINAAYSKLSGRG